MWRSRSPSILGDSLDRIQLSGLLDHTGTGRSRVKVSSVANRGSSGMEGGRFKTQAKLQVLLYMSGVGRNVHDVEPIVLTFHAMADDPHEGISVVVQQSRSEAT